MKNRLIVEVLVEVADRYFHPETGEGSLLLDEFNTSPEFVLGQQRGHQDAYSILLGLADYFSVTELESARG